MIMRRGNSTLYGKGWYGKRFCFTPKPLAILLTLILLPCFISLGLWQYHRGLEKQQLINQYALRSQQEPLNFQDLTTVPGKQLRYQRVSLTGYFDNQHNFLWDNQIHNHHVGYYVLTPFVNVQDPTQRILINRGWLPANPDRNILPVIPGVNGQHSLSGIIYLTPAKPFLLSRKSRNPQDWPKRIQVVEYPALSETLDTKLIPLIVVLDANQVGAFQHPPSPGEYMTPERHRGYALQWFAFATALLVIFASVNLHPLPPNKEDL